jgi:phage/plasmid-associated DNA primase
MKLVKAAFGNYLKDMNSKTLVNGKTDGASASPDIAMTKGTHILSFEEIGENEKIDINMVKRLSGGTDLAARYLFQQLFEFTPMFTMFMVMNELFDLKSFNHAIVRRFKIIEFKSKFWTESDFKETGRSVDDMGENEFWEENMRTIPKEWGVAFMSIVMHHYREYSKTGRLKHPKQVLRSTKSYLHTKDHFFGFIEGDLVPTEDQDDFIEMGEFLSGIRAWNSRVNDSKTKISRENVIAYFQQHVEYKFDPKTNRLHGYLLRKTGEDAFEI